MGKLQLLSKVSFHYWRCHKGRFLTLALSVIMGAAALTAAALLIRSEKKEVFNWVLDIHGNYDIIIYEQEPEFLQTLEAVPEITKAGFYYEMGYAGVEGGEAVYKVASYADEESEVMYHMSCVLGEYPRRDNEIAIDRTVANALGIAPYPGEQVELVLYDLEKQELSRDSFLVSGILDISAEERYGGYERYPLWAAPGEHDMPLIVMPPAKNECFHSSVITIYVQTEAEIGAVMCEIVAEAGDENLWKVMDDSTGRTSAYSYVLGVLDSVIWHDYDGLNFQNIQRALADDNVVQDFYSSVLIPIVSLFILLVVCLTLTSFMNAIVKDRLESLAILRFQGMSALGSGLYLAGDLVFWVAVFTIMGLLLGSVLHIAIIEIINNVLEMRLPLGFQCNPYVQAVTVNPYVYAVGVMGCCTVFALLLSMRQVVKRMPLEMMQGRKGNRHGRAVHKQARRKAVRRKGWLAFACQAMNLHDSSILFMMVILMGSAFFGYTYFSAKSEMETRSLQWMLGERGLGEWDYVAKRSDNIIPHIFNIENRHDCGIDMDAYRELANLEEVDAVWQIMINGSTRLTYPQGTESDAVKELLEDHNLRQFQPGSDAYEQAFYEAENAMWEAIGYSPEETVYAVPTVGLLWEQMEALEPYLAAGELNRERLAVGEEVVVAVTEDKKETVLEAFSVGETLPLSDILLSTEEDRFDFSSDPTALKEPVYAEEVWMPEAEVVVTVKSSAFGTRKNIETRVGAILVIDDMEMAKQCMATDADFMVSSREEIYGVNLLCLAEDTFAAWGLPDHLYTKVGLHVQPGGDMETVDKAWYRLLAQSKGMTAYSVMDIKSDMQVGKNRIMYIYYVLISLLCLITGCGVAMQLYTRIRRKSMDIACMRAIGLTIPQLAKVILYQNIFYPVVGIICAGIPAAICQSFFYYVRKQIDSGIWNSTEYINSHFGKLPFWAEIPYRYNLFSYHPVLTLLLLFFIAVLLMAVVTVPQLVYIRRMQVVEDLEKVTF